MNPEVNGLSELKALDVAVARAAEALKKLQRDDGHWLFELEADATIPSEYVLLRHYLGEADDHEIERKIANYLRRTQASHGGWPLFKGGEFDISASVKAYYCLKMIGDNPQAPHMARARTAILAYGGAQRVNVFTRILLAQFGQLSWSDVPAIPVELVLLPRWFPVHLSRMSYWARTVIVPLLVLAALQRRAKNRRDVHIAELFVPGKSVDFRLAAHQHKGWGHFFSALDKLLKWIGPLWPRRLRKRAIARCVAFVSERLNGEDGLGAIYPAMANAVMMFDALGYSVGHPEFVLARRAIDRLLVVREDEAYCQPCVSPVWDTALACHALLEAQSKEADEAAGRGLQWLLPRQELHVRGDWSDRRPDTLPGGWAFQYANPHYPDLDDTAVVVMALDRYRRQVGPFEESDQPIARAVDWIKGLQSSNGGWAAFDADNTDHYLNNIPFADHGALLDPPTSDVTARCISMLAQLGIERGNSEILRSALAFLEQEQLPDGSWFGRWGVNYIYGTWSVLCALNAVGFDSESEMVRKAAEWLISIQNKDGGWGEDCTSYRLDYAGHTPAASGASQTAWALLGLMAAGKVDHPSVKAGIEWLRCRQDQRGLWDEEAYTGGGFPRVFYLRYHGYSKYFALMALARYRNLRSAGTASVIHGL